jgi:hypothetical protein
MSVFLFKNMDPEDSGISFVWYYRFSEILQTILDSHVPLPIKQTSRNKKEPGGN